MVDGKTAFPSFAVKDLDEAKKFYGQTLGLTAGDNPMGFMELEIGAKKIMVYPKPDHEPAVFTILNFPVDDIDAAVDELTHKGVTFLQYDTDQIKTDEKGIARGDGEGPTIAWFTDPSGNILSVLEADPTQS